RLGADPLYCTLLASAAFYAYAALRRVGWAIEAMAATLAILALVKPAMLNVPDFGGNPTPLILAATPILRPGIWQRQSWRCLAGSFGLVLGLALALPTEYRWPIVFHVLLLTMLLIGATFEDALSRVLRIAGASLMLIAALRVLFLPLTPPPGV